MARTGRPERLLLGTSLLLCLLPVTRAIRDPDFWWHLRTGQLILQKHGLLGTDPYTYTVADHRWVMHEWGAEVLFALLHALGGIALIVAVLSLVTWLGMLCIYLNARMRMPQYVTLAMGILLAVIAGYPIWGPRTQMITFALTCLFILLAERHLRLGGRAVWALVPLTIVWCNLHSGFVIGLVFVGLMLLSDWLGDRLGIAGGASPERRRRLGLVLLVCLGVALINANGAGIYLYPFQTQGSSAQQTLIEEWHSPNFHMREVVAFEVMLLSLVAAVVLNRRLRARDAALLAAATVLSLQSVRHIALFIAACTPIWIEQVSLVVARVQTARRGGTAARRAPRRDSVARGVMALGLMGVVLLGYVGIQLIPSLTARESDLSYARDQPVCAARWLAASRGGLHIFNQYGEGGYLSYMLHDRGDRVFIFGDAALMGDQSLLRYGQVADLGPDWETILRTSDTDLVVFDTNTALDQLLRDSPNWTRVYADARTDAFVRRDRPVAGLADASVATAPPGGGVCRSLAGAGLGNPA
ncbi:MAG: hypothetical protein NVSMB29_07360 [Candidatus Dormibacteria bacterium]